MILWINLLPSAKKKQYFQFLLYIIPPPFYLHKSYLHKTTEKVHFSLHANKETTQKKTISRGLLKNLVL